MPDRRFDLWLEICAIPPVTIFVSSRANECGFTKQKRMRAMIIASNPDAVIEKIHHKLHRGATMIHDAEGTYNHERKVV